MLNEKDVAAILSMDIFISKLCGDENGNYLGADIQSYAGNLVPLLPWSCVDFKPTEIRMKAPKELIHSDLYEKVVERYDHQFHHYGKSVATINKQFSAFYVIWYAYLNCKDIFNVREFRLLAAAIMSMGIVGNLRKCDNGYIEISLKCDKEDPIRKWNMLCLFCVYKNLKPYTVISYDNHKGHMTTARFTPKRRSFNEELDAIMRDIGPLNEW